MKIKAAVLNEFNAPYEIEEIELSEIREDEILVKIVASGICNSDESVRKGHMPYQPPIVIGHEGAGIIEKIGKNITNFEVGDHVVISFAYCGKCSSCLMGAPAACTDFQHINNFGNRSEDEPFFTKNDGTPIARFFGQSSFATHSIVSPSSLTKVDKSVDLRLSGPLGCGFLTGTGTVFNGLKPAPGSTIAIFGTGAVGLASMMAAKISGCSKVIAIDIHENRLELAKELGATHTINSTNADLKEEISKLTDGKGVNYSIDTSGVPAVIKSAIDVLALGGTIAPVAISRPIEINTMLDFTRLNRKLVGVLMGQAVPQLSIPQLLEFYKEDKFAFDKLIKFYTLDEINEAAEDSNSGRVIKPILVIDETYSPGN